MPVEPNDHTHDARSEAEFEAALVEALAATGDGFRTDGASRLPGVLTRGRTLRRRRRAVIAGSVLALTLVTAGGAVVTAADLPSRNGPQIPLAHDLPSPSRTGPLSRPTPTASLPPTTASLPPTTGADVLAALKALLPPGTVDESGAGGKAAQGKAANATTPVFADVVFDDGHGKAKLSINLAREPVGALGTSDAQCPDQTYVPVDDCRSTTLPDGSSLLLVKGYEYPDKRVETKVWTAVLTGKDGRRIELQEWNAAADKDAPVSRTNPPLDFTQLTAVVAAPVWERLGSALPLSEGRPTTKTLVQPSQEEILATAAKLLPSGLVVAGQGGQDGTAHFTVDDGMGASLVEINVSRGLLSQPSGGPGALGVTVLPDGTQVMVRDAGDPGKGGTGIVRWMAQAWLPDGTKVAVVATNGPSPRLDADRKTPALTMDQLSAIASSPLWSALTKQK